MKIRIDDDAADGIVLHKLSLKHSFEAGHLINCVKQNPIAACSDIEMKYGHS